jgi:hypothetical protein
MKRAARKCAVPVNGVADAIKRTLFRANAVTQTAWLPVRPTENSLRLQWRELADKVAFRHGLTQKI